MARHTSEMGTIELRSVTTHRVEITVAPLNQAHTIDPGDEIVLVVNGAIIKRLHPHQAERMGLITGNSDRY